MRLRLKAESRGGPLLPSHTEPQPPLALSLQALSDLRDRTKTRQRTCGLDDGVLHAEAQGVLPGQEAGPRRGADGHAVVALQLDARLAHGGQRGRQVGGVAAALQIDVAHAQVVHDEEDDVGPAGGRGGQGGGGGSGRGLGPEEGGLGPAVRPTAGEESKRDCGRYKESEEISPTEHQRLMYTASW